MDWSTQWGERDRVVKQAEAHVREATFRESTSLGADELAAEERQLEFWLGACRVQDSARGRKQAAPITTTLTHRIEELRREDEHRHARTSDLRSIENLDVDKSSLAVSKEANDLARLSLTKADFANRLAAWSIAVALVALAISIFFALK